jgi:hypothetical protein
MLPIGPIKQDYDVNNRTAFTEDEQITMMTLWSIMRSPLIIGGEMTGFDGFTMKLITNEAVLKMHANSRNARQIFRKEINGKEFILWAADDFEGGKYLAVFNASDEDGFIRFGLEGLEDIKAGSKAVELWTGESSVIADEFSADIPAHGAKVYKIRVLFGEFYKGRLIKRHVYRFWEK